MDPAQKNYFENLNKTLQALRAEIEATKDAVKSSEDTSKEVAKALSSTSTTRVKKKPSSVGGPGPTSTPGTGTSFASTSAQTAMSSLLGAAGIAGFLKAKGFTAKELIKKAFRPENAEAVFKLMGDVAEYGNEFYDPLQRNFGGLQNLYRITNETAKAQVEGYETIFGAFYGQADRFNDTINAMYVETASATKARVNALFAYFKNPEEVAQSYTSILSQLRETQILRFNEMGADQKAMLGTFEKGFGVSASKIADVMERSISLTGKASVDIFGEISNFSAAVASKTGVDFKHISQMTMDIITDVETFGNVVPEQAARISGALAELGVSFSNFSGLVTKFMNFDSAAESLGNLTTLFGISFDAMEMHMLAQTDQEEFLYRIREAFLETGRSVDDLHLAEKRLFAADIGMDVTGLENFLKGEREITDTIGATAKARDKDLKDGFQTMTQQMVLVNRSAEELKKYQTGRLMDPLRRDAKETATEFAILQGKLKDVVNELDLVKQAQAEIRGITKGVLGADPAVESVFIENLERQIAGMKEGADKEVFKDYLVFAETNRANAQTFATEVLMDERLQDGKMAAAILAKIEQNTLEKTRAAQKRASAAGVSFSEAMLAERLIDKAEVSTMRIKGFDPTDTVKSYEFSKLSDAEAKKTEEKLRKELQTIVSTGQDQHLITEIQQLISFFSKYQKDAAEDKSLKLTLAADSDRSLVEALLRGDIIQNANGFSLGIKQ